ncbi:hypothetical protein ACFU5O_21590 [Streptomyces sp. NPDC057445]|uniref:hypothetical protein n=1 Tax=Streptomyces sp. NPDC057445 TaxID=3346136 RepID=UPI00367A9C83
MIPDTELAASACIALEPSGRIAVDGALRSVSHPEVYVAGDAAAAGPPRAGTLRMACATALPTGSHAASSIIYGFRGREPRPLDFRRLPQCVSLGRTTALVQFVRADDRPHDRFLKGGSAARTKERIVRSALRLLCRASRRPWSVPLTPGMSRAGGRAGAPLDGSFSPGALFIA